MHNAFGMAILRSVLSKPYRNHRILLRVAKESVTGCKPSAFLLAMISTAIPSGELSMNTEQQPPIRPLTRAAVVKFTKLQRHKTRERTARRNPAVMMVVWRHVLYVVALRALPDRSSTRATVKKDSTQYVATTLPKTLHNMTGMALF